MKCCEQLGIRLHLSAVLGMCIIDSCTMVLMLLVKYAAIWWYCISEATAEFLALVADRGPIAVALLKRVTGGSNCLTTDNHPQKRTNLLVTCHRGRGFSSSV